LNMWVTITVTGFYLASVYNVYAVRSQNISIVTNSHHFVFVVPEFHFQVSWLCPWRGCAPLIILAVSMLDTKDKYVLQKNSGIIDGVWLTLRNIIWYSRSNICLHMIKARLCIQLNANRKFSPDKFCST
jgi:hypothetical protein